MFGAVVLGPLQAPGQEVGGDDFARAHEAKNLGEDQAHGPLADDGAALADDVAGVGHGAQDGRERLGGDEAGDVGRIQEGLLYINSRARDMILRSAENVYPVEIEDRIYQIGEGLNIGAVEALFPA